MIVVVASVRQAHGRPAPWFSSCRLHFSETTLGIAFSQVYEYHGFRESGREEVACGSVAPASPPTSILSSETGLDSASSPRKPEDGSWR